MIHSRAVHRIALAATLLVMTSPAGALAANFTLFESGQVRPLALSPDGTKLFAVDTPDDRLEVFDVGPGGLTPLVSIPVGLEPVAVAARSNTEVWVVNHLSDSVSVVDLTNPAAARVVRTLLVGDEPRDIVFGGPAHDRAFVTTAHRGQNTPLQSPECIDGPNDGTPCTAVSECPGGTCSVAELTRAGVGRADVWVFDANALGATLAGTPLTIVTLFGDTPRALAVTPDGLTVYAAVFHSGNRTTTVNVGAIPFNPGLPPPNNNFQFVTAPGVGLVVQFDGAHWTDERGNVRDAGVNFSLPDEDVFAIDAAANPPAQVAGPGGVFTGVGTVLFDMAVNPVSGKVYVANTEARNRVRFEGAGAFASLFKPPGEPASVRGHLHESRITVLDGATVTPRHLNKHINYGTCCPAAPNAENAKSLAFPLGMAVSSDGAKLYVAAFGSQRIGIFNTAALENDTFVPDAASQIVLTGGGPTGIVLDEAHTRLYVLTRFDDAISVVSTATGMETAHLPLHNPEPASVVTGRRFLYDARFTSSHGDSACASCHVFGDFDSLAWDLGDPDGTVLNNPGPITVDSPFGDNPDFHPMKGPMTTQSLRGMANHGPMHWRGDRTGGNDAPAEQPDSGTFDEDAAFKKFNVAFAGLLGRSGPLQAAEMQAFTDFILQVTYPPNPIRALDNSRTADQQAGRDFYFGGFSDTFSDCNGCHVLNPDANREFGVAAPGFFGTNGQYSFENETQFFKIPHLRNAYQKVGMFGMPFVGFFNAGDNDFKGDQVRGFGFLHDGSTDTVFRFHNAFVFNQRLGFPFGNPDGFLPGAAGDVQRRQMEQFILAYDSNLAPIVGQQVTRTGATAAAVDPRLDLMIARANAGECDLIAKGRIAGAEHGFLYIGGGTFIGDRAADPPIGDGALRAAATAAGQELTYTCAPPGSGGRIALDRDGDSFGDGDERDAGSDPSNPASIPSGVLPVCTQNFQIVFNSAALTEKSGSLSVSANVTMAPYNNGTVAVLAADNGGTIFSGSVPGTSIVLVGHQYKFKAPTGTSGITQVSVRDSTRVGRPSKIKLKAKHAWIPPAANETVATTHVTLNVGGVCFRGNATRIH